MFIHPRQADEVAARVPGVSRYQVIVTREQHQDHLVFRAELADGTVTTEVPSRLELAIREIMKLRGQVEIVPAGTIPGGVKKIVDERKWE
jgi:phenylacetate-CoA ligase